MKRCRDKPRPSSKRVQFESLEQNDAALDLLGPESESESTSSVEGEINRPPQSEVLHYSSEEDEWCSVDIETSENIENISITIPPANKSKRRSKEGEDHSAQNERGMHQLLLHVCHCQCLILHAQSRNLWLNDRKLQKSMRKIIPDSMRKSIVKFHRRVRNGTFAGKKQALSFETILIQLSRTFKKVWRVEGESLKVLHDGSSPRQNPVNLRRFRDMAVRCRGPVDIAMQVFISILRALEFKTRLIFSPPVICCNYERSKKAAPELYLYPTFWAEVYNPTADQYVALDPFVLPKIYYDERKLDLYFEPRGKEAGSMKMYYVVGLDEKSKLMNLTPKYMLLERIPLPLPGYRNHSKSIAYSYFLRFIERNRSTQFLESEKHLLEKWQSQAGLPEKYSNRPNIYKTHDSLILESQIPKSMAAMPDTEPVHVFKYKGKEERVILRSSLVTCRPVRAWLKDGREIIPNETALKNVKMFATTLKNKKDILLKEYHTNKQLEQGLFSFAQTRPYQALPIINGIVPKTEHCNTIFLFKPHMIPEGAVHLRHPGADRVALSLGVDYAYALVDFQFRRKKAYPILDGIVIAEQHMERVKEEWRRLFYEKILKDTVLRRSKAHHMWRIYLQKLQVLDRLRNYQ